jgi:hypothetical protein
MLLQIGAGKSIMDEKILLEDFFDEGQKWNAI